MNDVEQKPVMTEDRVKELLREYGISTPDFRVITRADEIDALDLKFPVALKVCSPRILHKTDVGGVKLDIPTKRRLKDEWRRLAERFPGEKFLVEPMAAKGLEIIVGLMKDKVFGLCLMLGIGGVFAELLEDVVFRAVPVVRADVEEMIGDLRAKKVFDGFRGMKVDKEAVIDLLLRVSRLGVDLRGKIDQLDMNPVIVGERGLCVVDAKLLMSGSAGTDAPRERTKAPESAELRPLLYPRSVALIGASTNPKKFSFLLLKNIVDSGFAGPVYPVNPNATEILGLRSYRRVADIDDDLDLAIIALPAAAVPEVVEECGRKGAKGLLIISTGFSEFGAEGRALESRVRTAAGESGMRIIGPNCQGFINARHDFFPVFAVETLVPRTTKGSIGLVAQSGSVGADFLQNVVEERLGLAMWVNVGNRLDVDESDFINFMNDDPGVSVIAAYLEGVKDGEKLLGVIGRLRKPMVVLKSGRTAAGRKAVQSHTAALAGNDRVWDGILRQHHVLRAESTEDLFDFAKALRASLFPKGERLLIVASSGGLGAVAMDLAEEAGLTTPDLGEDVKARLRPVLAPQIRLKNPLDIGEISGDSYARPASLGIMDGFDIAMLIFGDPIEDAARVVAEYKRATDKPVVVVFSGGGDVEKEERAKIYALGVPVYPSVTRAMRFFEVWLRHKSRSRIN